ncbi:MULTISPECIES: putative phage tail protein [unclassified Burkholderia]|uniref:putative phage tail protein n=1 Tax=unclassified Burkholderia TaxID=2613784 RepID=UPI00163B01DA|nr:MULTISPECIES: putative phage tail protein [unclassified Burkholderia]
MTHAELLALLLPPVSYDATQPNISASLAAEGKVLDDAQASGIASLDAMTPEGDVAMLPDWERVLSLPEPALGPDQSDDVRLAMVLERLRETGEIDRDYFLFVALRLGFSASLTEFHPYRIGTPIGQPLYGDDWMFVWRLTAPAQTPDLPNALLESVLQRIKPAHTVLHFVYDGDPALLLHEDSEGFLMTEENDYWDFS